MGCQLPPTCPAPEGSSHAGPWKQRTIAPILWLAHEFLSGAAIIGKLYGMAVRVRVPKLVRRD